MANAHLAKTYGCTIKFVDHSGNAVAINSGTKPLRWEPDSGSEAVGSFTDPLSGAGIGQYTMTFTPLAAGVCSGKWIADADATPAGESELIVPVAIVVDAAPAGGATFTLGTGVDKPQGDAQAPETPPMAAPRSPRP